VIILNFKKITLLVLTSLFFLSAMVVTSSAKERRVGVAVGSWFKYGTIDVSWSSNDPSATFPPPDQEWLGEFNKTEWIFISVEDVSGTNITFQATFHYKNGTEQNLDGRIDINDGTTNGVMSLTFISADLAVNDTLYSPALSYPDHIYPPPYITWKINETIVKTYPDGARRETNHVKITWTSGDTETTIFDLLWDKQTGVLVESKSEAIRQTTDYLTIWSASYRISDSNLWTAPEFPTLSTLLIVVVIVAVPTITAISIFKLRHIKDFRHARNS